MRQITIVGHRGAKGEAPENTLAGFEWVRQQQVAEVELDVRLAGDDTLIVLHDKNLKRTVGIDASSLDYAAADLAQLDARHSFPHWPQSTGVPTLAAVFDCGAPDLHYQLEVKGESLPRLKRLADQLAQLVEAHHLQQQVVVTSSHAGFLAHLGKRHPHLARGYICEHHHQQPLRRSRELGVQWLMPGWKLVTPTLIKKATEAGMQISVWTVNDLATAETLTQLGISSLITDFPSTLRYHFGQTG